MSSSSDDEDDPNLREAVDVSLQAAFKKDKKDDKEGKSNGSSSGSVPSAPSLRPDKQPWRSSSVPFHSAIKATPEMRAHIAKKLSQKFDREVQEVRITFPFEKEDRNNDEQDETLGIRLFSDSQELLTASNLEEDHQKQNGAKKKRKKPDLLAHRKHKKAKRKRKKNGDSSDTSSDDEDLEALREAAVPTKCFEG